MDYEKLKTLINKRREWNIGHMERPNLVNLGLVQALNLIESLESGEESIEMGAAVMSYTREKVHEIAEDPRNMILGSDTFTDMLIPLGCPGDVVDVLYPDGVEEVCVEESVARIMIEGLGKAMLREGTLTQEEYEEYLSDPYMEAGSHRILMDVVENHGSDNIYPLFGGGQHE